MHKMHKSTYYKKRRCLFLATSFIIFIERLLQFGKLHPARFTAVGHTDKINTRTQL